MGNEDEYAWNLLGQGIAPFLSPEQRGPGQKYSTYAECDDDHYTGLVYKNISVQISPASLRLMVSSPEVEREGYFVNQQKETMVDKFVKLCADAKVQLVADGYGEMDLSETVSLNQNVMLLLKISTGEL